MHYVELNPVRAGLVTNAWDWPWSSTRTHTAASASQHHDPLLDWNWPDCMKAARLGTWQHADWKASLAIEPPPHEFQQIRKAIKLGEPLGSETFVKTLEQSVGRRLRILPQGRPKLRHSLALAG